MRAARRVRGFGGGSRAPHLVSTVQPIERAADAHVVEAQHGGRGRGAAHSRRAGGLGERGIDRRARRRHVEELHGRQAEVGAPLVEACERGALRLERQHRLHVSGDVVVAGDVCGRQEHAHVELWAPQRCLLVHKLKPLTRVLEAHRRPLRFGSETHVQLALH